MSGTFCVTGTVVRVLRAAPYFTEGGTAHTCLVLFRCTEMHPFPETSAPAVSCRMPVFLAVYDADVLATLSPLWLQTLLVSRAGDGADARAWRTLRGPEATAQAKCGADAWHGGAARKCSGAAVCKALCMLPSAQPVRLAKRSDDVAALTRKHVAAMLPHGPARSALAKCLPGVAAFPGTNEGRRMVEECVQQAAHDDREAAVAAMLQLRETHLPPEVTLLSGWLRPSAARRLCLDEAHALCMLIAADEHGLARASWLCATADLLTHECEHAGKPLPHHQLKLQPLPPPLPSPSDGMPDAYAEERAWREVIARQRAGLQRSRSMPTATFSINLTHPADVQRQENSDNDDDDDDDDESSDDFTWTAGEASAAVETPAAAEAPTTAVEVDCDIDDDNDKNDDDDAAAIECNLLAESAYEQVAAFLLDSQHKPSRSTLLMAWCGSPGAFVTGKYLDECTRADDAAAQDATEPETMLIAPNDALALAFCKYGLHVHAAGDALAGRLPFSCSSSGGFTLVLLEAHLLGTATICRLFACFERVSRFVLVGDPHYSLGAALPHHGGALFRDAWASGSVSKAYGGQVMYGAFDGSTLLPDPASTAALFDRRAPMLVHCEASTHGIVHSESPGQGHGTSLRIGRCADAASPDEPVCLVAGADTALDAWDGDWREAATLRAGNAVLFVDTGELRRVESVGRLHKRKQDEPLYEGIADGALRANDADGFISLAEAATAHFRDHRLCCGTGAKNVASLAVHADCIVRADRLPLRMAAAVLPAGAFACVRMMPAKRRKNRSNGNDDDGDGNAITYADVTLDDLRAACKLARHGIDAPGCGAYADMLERRAKGRVRGSVFDMLRNDALRSSDRARAAATSVLTRMRTAAAKRAEAVAQNTTFETALVIVRVADAKSARGIGANAEQAAAAAIEMPDCVFQEVPPREVLDNMLPRDFEAAVQDRINALLDASDARSAQPASDQSGNCNENEGGGGGSGESWAGSASRYPFPARMAELLPSVRALMVTDMAMRERVAVTVACKLCKGNEQLEGWLLRAEQALCRARVQPSIAGEAVPLHVRNVANQLARTRPLLERAIEDEDGETANMLERALLNMRQFLLQLWLQ